MDNTKIALIILSKILEMPLERYLTFVNKKTNADTARHESLPSVRKKGMVYARVLAKDGKFTFAISDPRLANSVPIDPHKIPGNGIVALKWINTRNAFSKHILKSLLDYQRAFWLSGKEADLKPLALRQFLLIYPFQYLDQSRLSRLLPTLRVETPLGKVLTLRKLFPSKKRSSAYRIEGIINQHDAPLKDKDIQSALALEGIRLSLRTICNCRKLLNIPNYKQRLSDYYGKDMRFSQYVRLSRGQQHRIPCDAGVYELNIPIKVQYAKHDSNVLYIGSSKNLRKRVLNYSGAARNSRLTKYVNGSDLHVRYFLTEHYIQVEKELLKQFKRTYGELPKGNVLGA